MYYEYLQISSFETKRKKTRDALSAKFVPVYVLEKIAVRQRKLISVFTSHFDNNQNGATLGPLCSLHRRGCEAPLS